MNYDVIVVGGGHAGCEAALASARSGLKTALFTIYLDTIAMMSCNPSIGGPGKSHIVAEVDILGGEIGKHIDKYNLQLKHLNTSKGPAARITRGQADKYWYRVKMKHLLEDTPNLDSIQGTIDDIIIEDGQIKGVISDLGLKYKASSVVLATGTFLKGRIIIGNVKYPAGRIGEKSAEKLSDSLKKNGIIMDRYQTATPPRIDMRTVDFSKMKELHGEDNPKYFSLFTKKENNNNAPTWLTYTTSKTIKVAQDLLEYSPIVSGIIETHGPRHCPSLDRKVLNFPEKTNHQIFLELESKESNELYVNGLTTAMPPFAQEKIMRTIAGLEDAKIMRYGYAVEYDYAPSSQLYPSLESKKIKNLYFAGQINGTSGYEEAAAQGFLAGVNASRKVLGTPPVIIDRTEGYLGVLIDDIIHKKTPEPYRVLPSRAEYRLTLRFDNAFMRLLDKTKEIGLVSDEKIKFLEEAIEIIKFEVKRINGINISMKQANEVLKSVGSKNKFGKGLNLSELLKQKEVTYDSLALIIETKTLPTFIKNQIETIIKYNSFIEREKIQIEKFKKLESLKIPEGFKFENIIGLSNIAKDGLEQVKPISIGEATRISGVTGNDIAILITIIEKLK